MRLVLPHGGYGLGNDLIPWAKGYILASLTGAQLLHPAWGNNARGYARFFGTSSLDWQWYRLLVRALPKVPFTEDEYRAIGENDFAKAAATFVTKQRLRERRHYVVTVTGPWGAYSGLGSARHFVLAQLMATRFTQANLLKLNSLLSGSRLTVGVHVRLGDFGAERPVRSYEGLVNTRLPLAWYRHVCDKLVSLLGADRLQFIVASDGPKSALCELLDGIPAIFTGDFPNTDCSDLIALSEADLLVCSLSTYSVWAAFLSRNPYIWFAPNLTAVKGAYANRMIRGFGIYDDVAAPAGDPMTRGCPVGMDGALPEWLSDYVEMRLAMKNPTTDLVRGGAARLKAPTALSRPVRSGSG